MVIVEYGLNKEQVSCERPNYIEQCILVFKVVLIVRVFLISSGIYIETLLNCMLI